MAPGKVLYHVRQPMQILYRFVSNIGVGFGGFGNPSLSMPNLRYWKLTIPDRTALDRALDILTRRLTALRARHFPTGGQMGI